MSVVTPPHDGDLQMLPVREAFGDPDRTQEGWRRGRSGPRQPPQLCPWAFLTQVILLALPQSRLLQCVVVAGSSLRPIRAKRLCDLDKCLVIAVLLTDFMESFIAVTPVLYIVYFYGNSKIYIDRYLYLYLYRYISQFLEQ